MHSPSPQSSRQTCALIGSSTLEQRSHVTALESKNGTPTKIGHNSLAVHACTLYMQMIEDYNFNDLQFLIILCNHVFCRHKATAGMGRRG